MPVEPASLSRLFHPSSVAVIGASADPRRIGGRPLHYLKAGGFAGAVYAVNPNRTEIQGLRAHTRIGQVPGPVDLAVIALPAQAAVTAAAECADAGVGAAIVFSADFAETGDAGVRRQAELSGIAKRSGMRILGPNCLGVFNANIGLYCTFSSTLEEDLPRRGRTAIVSQSGGYGSHMYVAARNRGIDVSYWITTGNECDIEFAECLQWVALQDDVDVILAYAEGVRSGRVLAEAFVAAKQAGKAVLMLKAGRSRAGTAAVSTHTAAMSGTDSVYAAMFRQYGVCRVGNTEELVDAAYVCSRGAAPQNDRIGLVSISGAMGVQMADAAEESGLDVAEVPAEIQRHLKTLTPFAATRNPIDITAQAFNDLRLVEQNLVAVLESKIYASMIAFFTVTVAAPAMADKLFELLAPLPRRFPHCLQILAITAPVAIAARYEAAGYLVFEEPVRAIRAIAAARAARMPRHASGAMPASMDRLPAQRLRDAACSEGAGKVLLAELGIQVPAGAPAVDASEAAEVAARLGYPVALKIASPDIAHKSDVGGVALDVAGADELAAACRRILDNARSKCPGARVDGFLVERMANSGMETIVGIHRDAALGPVVMFGLGGIQAEIYGDVTLRLAPVDEAEALRMIMEIRAWPLLEGFRGRQRTDVQELARIVSLVSRFAAAHEDLVVSLDINPLIVYAEGRGAVAADAVLVLSAE